MSPESSASHAFRPAGFRLRLWLAMMLIVCAITAAVLSFAESNLEANVAAGLQGEFQNRLAERHHVQEIRRAALAERCRALVGRPRIHAALEDNAPDLLYPSAQDALSDLMGRPEDAPETGAAELRAQFYRFLGPQGGVIPAPADVQAGTLPAAEETPLALPELPAEPQTGYLVRRTDAGSIQVSEFIATPIFSSETGEVISALVLGFKPLESSPAEPGFRSGLCLGGRLYAGSLEPAGAALVQRAVSGGLAAGREAGSNLRITIGGLPQLLFYTRLNPGSLYAPAYEVALYSLAPLEARQRHLRRNILAWGALVLLGALIASRFVTRRLSAPVEKLVVESERSARFSADASHQLKTPVTVLRAGLEELLARQHFTPAECDEISALIHQTYRLSTLVDDLMLLSRMDAGRLKLDLNPVNLSRLIEASVDDLGALPDSEELAIEAEIPADLWIAGEKRYTAIILQNLLENARKYNRRGGRIRIAVRSEGDSVWLSVGNTGQTIAPAAQASIFERFHRGIVGENVPGYGLGLNLARELARIHQGDLRLARSENDWTEFELRLSAAAPAATEAPSRR